MTLARDLPCFPSYFWWTLKDASSRHAMLFNVFGACYFWSSSNSLISAQTCPYKPLLRRSLSGRPARGEPRTAPGCPAQPRAALHSSAQPRTARPRTAPHSPGLPSPAQPCPAPHSPGLPCPAPHSPAQPAAGEGSPVPRCHGNRPGMPLAQPSRSPLRSACSADSSIVCRTVVFPSANTEIASSRRQKAGRKGTEQG